MKKIASLVCLCLLLAACGSDHAQPATEAVIVSAKGRHVVRFDDARIDQAELAKALADQPLPVDIQVMTASDGGKLSDGTWLGPGSLSKQAWRLAVGDKGRLTLFRVTSDGEQDIVVELQDTSESGDLVRAAAERIAEDGNRFSEELRSSKQP